jgi:hypothetical protein
VLLQAPRISPMGHGRARPTRLATRAARRFRSGFLSLRMVGDSDAIAGALAFLRLRRDPKIPALFLGVPGPEGRLGNDVEDGGHGGQPLPVDRVEAIVP